MGDSGLSPRPDGVGYRLAGTHEVSAMAVIITVNRRINEWLQN